MRWSPEPEPEHTLHYGTTICLMFVGGKSIPLLIRIKLDFMKIMCFFKINIWGKLTDWATTSNDGDSRKV